MSCNYFYRLDEIKALDLKNPGKEKIPSDCKYFGFGKNCSKCVPFILALLVKYYIHT